MQLRFFLVRHGETVDNVANIIAGVRDSPLTNHGFQQAKRLGQYLNASDIDISHIFASPLQRALITAEQILQGQSEGVRNSLSVIPIPSLREQDFGLFEGAAYGEYRPGDVRKASVETTEMMEQRAQLFIEQYLVPMLGSPTPPTVVIVSHGRMLGPLWAMILAWINPVSVVCNRELLIENRSIDHRHIGAWSNTGFVDVVFRQQVDVIPSPPTANRTEPESSLLHMANGQTTLTADQSPVVLTRISWHANIAAINGRDHLQGFQRTRGGVGSSRFDARQSTLDKFFPTQRPA